MAIVQRLDVGEEAIVVGEADVHAGSSVYALARCVEGLDDERHFLRAGRCGGFVDLDPRRARLDEPVTFGRTTSRATSTPNRRRASARCAAAPSMMSLA